MAALIQTVLQERAGARVALVMIANPAKLNALSAGAIRELTDTTLGLAGDAQLRAVVITGAGGKAFSGGVNVEDLGATTPATARDGITRLHRCISAVRECPVPVIARINGYCIGGALELAAACDLRIAADHARFGMPEVRLGIPSVIEAALLARLMGAGRARWLLLTGELIDAAEALRWGFVERVVDAAGLDAEVDQALEAILAGGAQAIRAQKRLCKLWEEAPLAESIRASVEEFARAYESGEPNRRVAAFRKARARKR